MTEPLPDPKPVPAPEPKPALERKPAPESKIDAAFVKERFDDLEKRVNAVENALEKKPDEKEVKKILKRWWALDD